MINQFLSTEDMTVWLDENYPDWKEDCELDGCTKNVCPYDFDGLTLAEVQEQFKDDVYLCVDNDFDGNLVLSLYKKVVYSDKQRADVIRNIYKHLRHEKERSENLEYAKYIELKEKFEGK